MDAIHCNPFLDFTLVTAKEIHTNLCTSDLPFVFVMNKTTTKQTQLHRQKHEIPELLLIIWSLVNEDREVKVKLLVGEKSMYSL